jgi:hypothetical protein
MSMREDYLAWRALGPGGLPYNPLGWMVASALRPLKRDAKSVDVYDCGEHAGVAVSTRAGVAPCVGHHPIPHRQLDQQPTFALKQETCALIPELAAERPEDFRLDRSLFEGRGEALFAARSSPTAPWLRDSRGEVAHVHAHDGSLHAVFHPRDAAAIIAAGRGERHPLCGVPLLGIPMTYLLLYAPRDHEELRVVRELLRRAAGLN